MRRTHLFIGVATLLVSGCQRVEPFDPFDPNEQAEVPSWIMAEWETLKHSCEDSPYWDEPGANLANTYFAGSMYEDGDAVFGNEFWLLYPNPTFEGNGFEECQVVWDLRGTIVDSSLPGASYAMNVSLQVDEEQSTCPENWEGREIYVGFETLNATYHIMESPGGGVSLAFDSGTVFGSGELLSNGIQWISSEDCKVF